MPLFWDYLALFFNDIPGGGYNLLFFYYTCIKNNTIRAKAEYGNLSPGRTCELLLGLAGKFRH
jgi:hypothetical protein